MTYYELAARDLLKAQKSLDSARKKPNVTAFELERLEELCKLRKEILEKLDRRADDEQRAD